MARCPRTCRDITALLASEGATWREVVRTACHLADVERGCAELNRVRTELFDWMGLGPAPASVGCRRASAAASP